MSASHDQGGCAAPRCDASFLARAVTTEGGGTSTTPKELIVTKNWLITRATQASKNGAAQ